MCTITPHAPPRGFTLDAHEHRNTLLKALSPEIVLRLHLSPVKLELNHELEYPGTPVKSLYFVEAGMASMTTTFGDGHQVEVCMFGYESVIGVSALMGTRRALNRVYTQIEGHGFRCPLEYAQREFALGGQFQTLCLRYVQAQLLQAFQSAGCNATHNLEQRLARWLLLCADRSYSSTFKMSQEYLAHMLGSSRPTVSMAAGTLKEEGLIQYTRGVIHIIDAARLQQRACECYGVIKNYLDNYLDFDTPDTA